MLTINELYVNSQYGAAENQSFAFQFKHAKFRGFVKRVWATITGQPKNLLDMEAVTKGKALRCSRYGGSQTVSIQQIKASEGRCQDFDQDFNPLKSHNQNRWVSIANAWQRGVYLPAVDLIKIGDVYIIRDGHHRISVARFMGSEFIDALVTEWELED